MSPTRSLRALGTACALSCLASVASAQIDWLTFHEDNAYLVASNQLGLGDTEEKDYAWDDIDQDGDIDLICVRKQPFTSAGRYPNVLFMNEGGVLVDRTAQSSLHAFHLLVSEPAHVYPGVALRTQVGVGMRLDQAGQ